jgi:hypothetical protein
LRPSLLLRAKKERVKERGKKRKQREKKEEQGGHRWKNGDYASVD